MSEPKHTPTPWELDLHDDHSYIRHGGEVIASVDTWMDERPEADARLIVTAVNAHYDLLEAAKAALAYFEQCVMNCDPDEDDVEEAEMLRAAIAKATEAE